MTPQEYKDKTIVDCRELVKKYRNPRRQIFFNHLFCNLCKTYYAVPENRCQGCFVFDGRADACSRMETYRLAGAYHELKIPKMDFTGLEIRARFHELTIEILKKIDAQFFTPEGWEYEAFAAIRELDRKLAEGVIK